MGWSGKIIGKTDKTITLLNPRPFHGFPKGTPDLIGWESKSICEYFWKIGETFTCKYTSACESCRLFHKLAVFTAIEVKTHGAKATKEQSTFIDTLNKMGGKGIIYYE